MARKGIKAINLAAAISEVLKEYGDECYEVLSESVKETADEAMNKLRSVDHFAPDGNPSGDYSKDWVVDEYPTSRLKASVVVHNEGHYRLTHLLENGHVSRNGTGRTFGKVPAYPHIGPINAWAQQELPRKVKEKLQ